MNVTAGHPWNLCRSGPALVRAALAGFLLWAYWPTLLTLAERWSADPQYSHGFLVPVFALAILWARRDRFPEQGLAPSWWGVLLLALGLALRLVAAYHYLEPLDAFSLLPSLVGVCLLAGGVPALRWSWPALAFLAFMLPLPFQAEVFLAHPLRRLATASSTYLLQLLGFPALAEGNVIVIEGQRLGVIDACSGLGMLMTFFALSTAAALIVQRPPLDRVVLIVSAIPIALVANILRVTATAVAHNSLGSEAANAVMHDLAGWLMMPLAVGLLWLELRYLDRLLVASAPPGPLPLDLT
jgi:exosortase